MKKTVLSPQSIALVIILCFLVGCSGEDATVLNSATKQGNRISVLSKNNVAKLSAQKRPSNSAKPLPQKRPSIKISQFKCSKEGRCQVSIIVYRYDIDWDDARLYVDDVVEGYTSAGDYGAPKGTSTYTFYFSSLSLKDGLHRATVVDTRTKDRVSRTFKVKAGRAFPQ